MAWTLMLIAWAGAVAGPVLAWLAWRRLGPARPVRRALAATAFSIAYGLAVWAFLIEPEMLVVRHVTIESPTWRGPPLRIGVLSDTHVSGPHMPAARVSRIVERLTREDPDLVVYVGDYVGDVFPGAAGSAWRREEIEAGAAALSGARARLGRFAVLGNHDWWYGESDMEGPLQRAGVPVLENYAQRVARPEGAFWVAGLADYASPQAPSAAQALAAVPDAEPVIVLTHWPDAWPQVPARVALTIAAHSHCGQVNFPIIGRPITPSPGSARWPCGRYDEGGRILYVTGGVGTSILPVRFRAPPEIVIVSLRGRP